MLAVAKKQNKLGLGIFRNFWWYRYLDFDIGFCWSIAPVCLLLL